MAKRQWLASFLVWALLWLSSGCAPSESEPPNFEVFDSSGVQVVVSHNPAGFDSPWTLSEEPLLRIGKGRDEEPYLFGTIQGATRFMDGSVVVFDGSSRELRSFDSRGQHLVTFGGRGDGPGEFNAVYGGIQRSADTILILDSGATVAKFRPDGRLFTEIPGQGFRAGDGSAPGEWLGVLPDGTLWGQRYPRQVDPPMGVVYRAPTVPVLSPPDRSEVRAIGEYLGQANFRTSWLQGYHPVFISYPRPSREPIGLLVGDNETFTIDLFDTGGAHLRRIKYPTGMAAPTNDQAEELRAAVLALHEEREAQGRGFPNFRRWLAQMPETTVWPGFYTLVADELGYIWALEYLPTDFLSFHFVERSDRPRFARVFHPDGYLLGSVELPAKFVPIEIGLDYVLGVEIDDLGVNELLLFGLSRN
jgi:hypothetical protein